MGGGPEYRMAGRFPIYTPEALDKWALGKIGEPVSSTSEARANHSKDLANKSWGGLDRWPQMQGTRGFWHLGVWELSFAWRREQPDGRILPPKKARRRQSSLWGPPMTRIDFDQINRAALASLPAVLARVLPSGKQLHREWGSSQPAPRRPEPLVRAREALKHVLGPTRLAVHP
jgi:hypothetical protein